MTPYYSDPWLTIHQGDRAVLIDLNGEYLRQAMGRNRDIPLGLDVA